MKIKDVIAYLQGNIRYFLYYNKYLNFLIPKHIKEQYIYRLNSMDKECLNNGSCKECGCKTTHLQFANKACDGNCYPAMENKYNWEITKRFAVVYDKNSDVLKGFKLNIAEMKFIKV